MQQNGIKRQKQGAILNRVWSLLSFFFLIFYAGLKISKHRANGNSRIPQLSAYTREDAVL